VSPQTLFYQRAVRDAAFLMALEIRTVSGAILSPSDDLSAAVGLDQASILQFPNQPFMAWRLPEENRESRVLEILPERWIPRIINRQHFIEVLALDSCFSRLGRRAVIFRETDLGIEAFFIPSVSPTAAKRPAAPSVGYGQKSVYTGLSYSDADFAVREKIRSLSMSKLVHQFDSLPRIGNAVDILRQLWLEIITNKLCFDQSLTELLGKCFGSVRPENGEDALEISANRLCAKADPAARHTLGGGGSEPFKSGRDDSREPSGGRIFAD
jgi:hypothetical protein